MSFPRMNCFSDILAYDLVIISSTDKAVFHDTNCQTLIWNSFSNLRTRHALSVGSLSLDFEYFNFDLISSNISLCIAERTNSRDRQGSVDQKFLWDFLSLMEFRMIIPMKVFKSSNCKSNSASFQASMIYCFIDIEKNFSNNFAGSLFCIFFITDSFSCNLSPISSGQQFSSSIQLYW